MNKDSLTLAENKPLIGITYSTKSLDLFFHWKLMFQGIVEAGGIPIAICCDLPLPEISDLVSRLDGLVLSGGGDVEGWRYGADNDPLISHVNPARDENEVIAFETALELGLPILALCRGAQLVNVQLGGTLFVDLARDRPQRYTEYVLHRSGEEGLDRASHNVFVTPKSILSKWAKVSGNILVNSQHHQGFDRLGKGVVPTAFAEDGLVEAFEFIDGRPMVAVQWHPEVLWNSQAHALNLLTSFVNSVKMDR